MDFVLPGMDIQPCQLDDLNDDASDKNGIRIRIVNFGAQCSESELDRFMMGRW